METSIGTDDLGVPPFQETPISVSLGGKQHEFKKKSSIDCHPVIKIKEKQLR